MYYIFRKIYGVPLLLLMLLFSFNNNVSAQDLKQNLPVDPKVTIGKFANGITYYIRTNKKPEKKVELRLVVNAGSILEDEDQRGLAHFMEHMNFNGTKNFQKNELVSYLQSIGVEFGADLNAYTSFDETVYILPIPTDKEGNLDKGFQIIEDWAHNALLTDQDIDDERGVVLEESRLGKGAEMRMMQKYLPEMLSGSLYAERLPIGKDEILKTFKYETIRRFYHDWYRPDLMAVVVVGDIDKETAMKYLKKHFEPMKNPKTERPRINAPVEARKVAKAMVLTDKEATGYRLQIIFPSTPKRSEVVINDYRSNMVRNLMTSVLNTRLSDLAHSSKPPFPYAFTYVDGWARGYESLVAFTMFGEEGPETALMALTAELKKAKKFGFNKTEIELAKKDMLSSMEKTYNERNTTESNRLVGEYIRNFLEQEPIPGIENEYEYYKNLLPGIRVEELNEEIKKLMSNMNFFSLITGPDNGKVKLPGEKELLTMTQAGFEQEVKQTEENKVATNLLQKEPVPGKVTKLTKVEGFDAVTYTLSNGIKVTTKPTQFKSDEIIIRGIKKGGSGNYGVADVNNVQYATDVIASMGYGQFTPTDLTKAMAGKTLSVSMRIGDVANTISGSSTVKDVEDMFRLMYLKLTNPRTDKELFEAYKKKEITQLQFLSANPTVAFIDTLIGDYYAKNPLAPSPIPKPKDFESLSMKRIVDIYNNEFSSADGYEFVIVGNVDNKSIVPLIEKYIGSLPQTGKLPSFKDNGVRPVSGNKTLKYYKGSEPKSMILSFVHGEAKYSEDFALKVSALAEVLNIRVIEELREKLGGIYGGGYRAGVEKEPYENYTITLQLPCGPENVDKLIKAADEVVAEIKKDGPKKEDLDKVKSQWHEQHRESIEKNSWWASSIQGVLFWGRSKDNKLDYDAWIDKLTVNDIKEAANKVFSGSQYTGILYPEDDKK
ncbi:MAG: insulinase family protein [Chitinophagales bacterium]|nr:insulinase family protein [Chitinophagales bacterium]